ncbi:hypothetical protein Tco_1008714 [Tanacetum coccineum]
MAFGIGNGNRDRWRWTSHESRDFTVKELTKAVEEKILGVDNGGDATIWNNWWKIGNVNAFSIEEMFSVNGNANIPNRSLRLWQAVMWRSGYFIWKEGNIRVFKDGCAGMAAGAVLQFIRYVFEVLQTSLRVWQQVQAMTVRGLCFDDFLGCLAEA